MSASPNIRGYIADNPHPGQHAALREYDALLAELALSRNLYDELFAQTEQLRAENQECAKAAGRLAARAVTAEAECQRLREALRDAPMPVNVDATPWDEAYADWWHKHRRAALDGTPSAAQTLEDVQTTRGTEASSDGY